MVWEISHTAEAWANVRARLNTWERDRLLNALVDVYLEKHPRILNSRKVDRHIARYRYRLSFASVEALAGACVEAIEQHMTCDNGGFHFYIDREGYHLVSCGDLDVEECEALGIDTADMSDEECVEAARAIACQ